jgi:pyruvate/oxaloacetate carboxyltransferase
MCSNAHPAFVEIISQLSPDEAKIIQYLNGENDIQYAEIKAYVKNGSGYNTILPKSTLTPFHVALDFLNNIHAYYSNLIRLGILEDESGTYKIANNVYDEIAEIKSAIHGSHLKVILETGALKSVENIYRASILAMAAGADFIKTSTGKIATNATPEATYVMCHAIKDWKEKTGQKVCYKPAGGVSTTEEAVVHYTLVKAILGNDWLNNESFRFGASRLANNLLTSILGQETKYF